MMANIIILLILACSTVSLSELTVEDTTQQKPLPITLKLENTNTNSIYDKIIIPLIVAVVASIITASLMRRNQKIAWLREQRAELFIKYMELIYEYFDKALQHRHDTPLTETQIHSFRIKSYSKVVRLVLRSKDKEKIDVLSTELLKQLLRAEKGVDETEISKTIGQMSQLFEDSLKHPKLK